MEVFFEVIVFMGCAIYAVIYLGKWCGYTFNSRPNPVTKPVLGILPVICFFIILFTLKTMASFDVVDSQIYILCYIAMGMAWYSFSMYLIFWAFDVSWIDDVLNANNKVALITVAACGIASTLIYAGANIGDGPGWWCVVFAGGLGMGAWLLLGRLTDQFTGAFEGITVDRDINCSIRIGGYLLASGIVLARASAGDWTSFGMTIIEFWAGWPVMVLTPAAIFVERHYVSKARADMETGEYKTYTAGSLLWGLGYIAAAILAVMFAVPPLA